MVLRTIFATFDIAWLLLLFLFFLLLLLSLILLSCALDFRYEYYILDVYIIIYYNIIIIMISLY